MAGSAGRTKVGWSEMLVDRGLGKPTIRLAYDSGPRAVRSIAERSEDRLFRAELQRAARPRRARARQRILDWLRQIVPQAEPA